MFEEKDLLNHAEFAVEVARKLGADMAEAYVIDSRELVIDVREGEVETLKQAGERGLGLRAITGTRTGFSFTSDFNAATVEDVARQALANARNVADDPFSILPVPSPRYPAPDIYDPDIGRTSTEEKIELARIMEVNARTDPRVKVVESATYQDGECRVAVVNSLGVHLSYRGTFCGVYIALVAEDDADSQTGFALDFRLKYRDLDPAGTGRRAAEKAVRMLGARRINTQVVPVILDPYVATGFLGLLGPALSGEAVQKGRSLFAGRVGDQVASSLVTVIDDGTLAGGISSAPFDGEGVSTCRTVLIDGGFLKGFLHNTYTAAKEGVSSTGNSVRGSFRSTPEVGNTNFFIQAGDSSPEKLMGEVEKGFYVTELMGLHTANPISGDFSLGAAGLWIEKGCFSHPVRGVAIAGNIVELLQRIDGVGNDLQFFGSKGSPTLRVSQMSISGS